MGSAFFTAYFCVGVVATIVTAAFVRFVAASGWGAFLIIFAAVAVGALIYVGLLICALSPVNDKWRL